MVRRTTHLVLVVLAVLVATGPSALVVADTGGATTTDSGVAAAVGPLDAPDDLWDETTDANVTDENLTDETDGNLTEDADENTTDDGTVENETVDDETTDATETLTYETTTVETTTNVSDGATTDLDADGTDATTVAADSEATAESESLASNATNEVENATSATDGTETDGTDTADVTETIDDTTGGAADASPEYASLDATAPSSARVDAETGDASLENRDVGVTENEDAEFDSGSLDDSDSATERERRAENETTAAGAGADGGTGDDTAADDDGGTGGDAAKSDDGGTGGDAGGSDAKSSGGGADSNGPPARDLPGAPPSGTEAVAGAGALAAVALFPHLADGLTLVSDTGTLSAASSTVTRSRTMLSLQGELDKVWRTATAFRYSRYDDSDPLDHETRATLHETVERSPGAYLSQVCERADVAVSTARHHLDVLEDEGLVTTAKVRGKRRYFPGHSDDVELAAALEDEEAAEVLRALARLGDSHGGRLADELDRDPSTVSHHLARLEDADLIEREREGRAVINRLAPEVEHVLDEGCDENDEEIAGDGEADAETDAEASAIAD